MNIRVLIAFVSLFLSLACVVGEVAKVNADSAIRPAPTETVTVEYVIVGTVNVRSCASTTCGVVGYYYAGDRVAAECFLANSGENWCSVLGGYIYAPCLGMEGVCR